MAIIKMSMKFIPEEEPEKFKTVDQIMHLKKHEILDDINKAAGLLFEKLNWPNNREFALARTNLQQAIMWARAAFFTINNNENNK